jgi:low affinity Fe/Cu permease
MADNNVQATSGFQNLATRSSQFVGSKWAFIIAVCFILAWAASGPIFHYSDTWQLVINTATTVVTFLIVFLIQNTQNRDARAINLKLDEIIRAVSKAHNEMIQIESLSDRELEVLAEKFKEIRAQCSGEVPMHEPIVGQLNEDSLTRPGARDDA